MFWKVLLLEKDKLQKSLILKIELILLVSLIIIVDLGQYLLISLAAPTKLKATASLFTWPAGLVGSIQFAGAHTFGGLLLVILFGSLTAREYSWRTFHLWLSRGVPRSTLLGAKFVISIFTAVLMVLIAFVVGGVVTGALTYIVYGTISIEKINLLQIVLTLPIISYCLLPYVALTFMLVLLSRSSVVAIGVGLVFLLFIESLLYTILNFIGGVAAQIGQYLPTGLEESLLNSVTTGTGSGSSSNIFHIHYSSPWIALAAITLYIVLFAGIGSWRFLQQNFTD
ncbi:ABC transporter permease subunit [Tengunoibacter tsumagoiensis]|uniref:Uncharacterized protein n=1 Tax=Tengunoibacter tsumagoiensis TaxID=2014871 RepID=A0A402A2R4_9CHLR|nr:ABC transporter permease subunit [Tengunoibacter tsumagoiensis]GCE13438.1 hypothetical protein KTT_32970 [Tengunoibacter tsumagoiensis]